MPTPATSQQLSILNLDWTPDWAQIIGKERPLILEVGFGNAEYLLHLARTYPDHNVIGVEISTVSLEKAERKIRNQNIPNACAIHARGESALYHLFEPASLAQVHVNYPDPWFKDRHAGRRFVQQDTLALVANRLKPNGMFYLATDILEYAEMSDDALRATPQLTNQLTTPWVDHIEGRIITKYEAKGYAEGRKGHYFVYQRNQQPAEPIPVYREVLPMPHMILTTPMSPEAIAQAVERTEFNDGADIHATLVDGFVNKHGRIVFEVHIAEPTLEQHTAIMMLPHKADNEYIVRYNTMGFPRPTLGMHRATAWLAEWVANLHPDAQITARKVRT
jgi:tRNA (guanine-N7-)-methyltransferase